MKQEDPIISFMQGKMKYLIFICQPHLFPVIKICIGRQFPHGITILIPPVPGILISPPIKFLFPWEESTLTWNSVVNSYSNYGLSSEQLGLTVKTIAGQGALQASPVMVAFDITDAVRSWISGQSVNYGIGLKRVNIPSHKSVRLYSNEGSTTYRPVMTYQYGDADLVRMELLYDHAYLDRFSNASSRIVNAALELQTYYMDEFNIWVQFTQPKEFYSYGDTCSASYSQACTCGKCENPTISSEPKQYHHTNLYNNLYRISPPTDTSTVKVAFLGHEGCECVEETCKSLSGLADKNRRVAVVSKFDSVDLEAIYFIHEFGHIFGIEDHYTNFYPPYPFENHCLYGPAFTQMLQIEDITICQGCRNIVDSFFDR